MPRLKQFWTLDQDPRPLSNKGCVLVSKPSLFLSAGVSVAIIVIKSQIERVKRVKACVKCE